MADVAPAVARRRRKLAEELVGLHHKHAEAFARIDELKAKLKAMATETGENFREVIDDRGVVKVSAGHDGKFKGAFPTVDERKYFDLPEDERQALAKRGIIEVKPAYGQAYYGAVTVDLF